MKYSLRYRVARFLRRLGIGIDARKHPAVKQLWKTINKLDGHKIVFDFYIEDNGDWSAVSTNLPGLMTGGTASDPIADMISDSIFTYFGVPPEYCDDRILNKDYMNQKKSRKQVSPIYDLRSCAVA